MDVAFIGNTAYVLVTLVGTDLGGSDVVGIYRVDGPNTFTVIADIGAFSLSHPPEPAFFIPTGVQYAMQPYRGGFLVTDGHHNRVLRVTLDGKVSELIAFDDIVPTGLAVHGQHGLHGRSGPGSPPSRERQDRVVRAEVAHRHEVASGARLARRRGVRPRHKLYALSQGSFPLGNAKVPPRSRTPAASCRVNARRHLHRRRGRSEPADVA